MIEATRKPPLSTQVLVAGYQKMEFGKLRERARASHPLHAHEAARVFVDRALDMEAETRLWYKHGNPGFQPFSPTATLGEHPGGGSAAAEPLAIICDKYSELSPEHKAAQRFIESARLHPRQLLAVLIRESKSHPRAKGHLCRGYDDIARDLPPVAQMLGFGPVSTMGEVRQVASTRRDGTCRVRDEVAQKPIFSNGMAIKNAARDGRAQLILLAQI